MTTKMLTVCLIFFSISSSLLQSPLHVKQKLQEKVLIFGFLACNL